MASPENDTKSSGSGGWLWLGLAPVLYVLSVGPVARFLTLIHASSGTHNLAKTFYSPLIWLRDNTFCKGPLNTYVEFWLSL